MYTCTRPIITYIYIINHKVLALYLIPVSLGGDDHSWVIPERVLETTRSLRYFVVEDIRSARRYLRSIDRHFPIDDSDFAELNEHTPESDVRSFLQPALEGKDIGLLSEAGMPGIADPGAILVAHAHQLNIKVVPLCGPSSILLALVSSGLNGQNFIFHGYLPVRQNERVIKLKELERRTINGETQILMETPYRAQRMLESIIDVISPGLKLCIASDITKKTESIRTLPVSEWKRNAPDLTDSLVVFLLGR